MIQEIIDKYYNFIKRKGWTYETAAEKIECSRTHLNRGLRAQTSILEDAPSEELLTKMKNYDIIKEKD